MSLFTLIAFAFLCAALYYICPLRLRWILLLLVSYGYYAYCGLSALPYILTILLTICRKNFNVPAKLGVPYSKES